MSSAAKSTTVTWYDVLGVPVQLWHPPGPPR